MPTCIEDNNGEYVNLDMVSKLKISGRSVIAELPGRSITMKNCKDIDEAKAEVRRLTMLGNESVMAKTESAVAKNATTEFVDVAPAEKKPVTRRRTKKK